MSDILSGMWKQLRGNVKQTWGKLTDDDIAMIDGQRDKLVGKLQERYGYSKAQADDQVDEFLSRYRDTAHPM
ncbi:MAG: CsbD family protein [Omnitrophica WOR_2 bacterium]